MFDGKFLTTTEMPYIGDAKPEFAVEAIAHEALSFGTPVQLEKPDNEQKYPFGFKTAVQAAGVADGIVAKGLMYDESGKAIAGKTCMVVVSGLVCVPIDTSLANAKFGDDVNYDGTKYAATGGKKIGTVASNVFKAQSLENGNLVDAIYVRVAASNK